MTDFEKESLASAVSLRKQMQQYQDNVYLNLIQQANTQCKEILRDDLGLQFVTACGNDVAGEIVRNYFADTTDFGITVDQMAKRMLQFSYENDYDPIAQSGDLQKVVYAYNDSDANGMLSDILFDLDKEQVKLFSKESHIEESTGKQKKQYQDHQMIQNGKANYVKDTMNQNGELTDEYTGEAGDFVTRRNGATVRRLQVDHVQAAATASYNEKYISSKGVEDLKAFFNSEDNFAMMLDTANQSKGDAKVIIGGEDITHRATAQQYTDAVSSKWENVESRETRQQLIDKGYLNSDGKVPKAVKTKLLENIKHSQNEESKTILNDVITEGGSKKIAAGAYKYTKEGIRKIVAGQIIYYMMPPLLYEIRISLHNKKATLEDALESLQTSGKRICNYVTSKLSAIFSNIAVNSLKKFIKSFFDILINMVRATVKKMLKIARMLVLSAVDAIRIVADRQSTANEKADAVCNLFAITITNCAVEALFECIEHTLHIPEWLLTPLQVITTVVCTNFTMLVLQKADLFNVRFGFKIQKIKEVFTACEQEYETTVQTADLAVTSNICQIIQEAKAECLLLNDYLTNIDPYENSVSESLEAINRMFDMEISFKEEWLQFIGMQLPSSNPTTVAV